VDVDAYLDRIEHPRVPVSATALRSLHEAHVRAIPFENVDVVLGTHPGLELGVISDKLVRRHRGGYCYEHAQLFAAVLERLGFAVQRRIARVQPHRPGPRPHMILAGAPTGFGWEALHSSDDTPQHTAQLDVVLDAGEFDALHASPVLD
jgi:N-hydroxyarylamine O-acetyltransferase